MMSTTKSRIHYWLAGLILGLFVAGGTHFVLAWTAPGSNPPNGNVSGPITTSSVDQSKAGSFLVTGSGKRISAPSFCLPGTAPTGGCITQWPSGGSSLWTKNGNDIYYTGGDVGIGIQNPNYPLHISSPNGGFLEFAGDYSGSMGNWGAYVGAVVKKDNHEVMMGIGGQGSDAPGITARSDSGGQFDLFPHYGSAIVLQAHKNLSSALPILLNTNKLWVGQIPYGGASSLPQAALHIEADGNVIKVGGSSYSGALGYSGTVHGLHLTRSGKELLTGFSSGGDAVWSGYTNNKKAHMYLRSNGEFVLSPENGHLTMLLSQNVKIGDKYSMGSGSSAPLDKLHVFGRVRASDGFCIGSSCINSWSAVGGGFQSPATTQLDMNYKAIDRVSRIELQQSESWEGIDFKNNNTDMDVRLSQADNDTLRVSAWSGKPFLTVGNSIGSLKSVHSSSGGGIRANDIWANSALRTQLFGFGSGANGFPSQLAYSFADIVNKGSDSRLKHDVSVLEGALSNVLQLRPVSFVWNEGQKFRQPTNKLTEVNLGFIAQEVMEILPETVAKTSEGYYSLDYTAFVPVLTEAIKEQQSIINAQQSTIDALRAEIEAIKDQL